VRVLGARYPAQRRTLTLAGPDGVRDDALHGSITALLLAPSHIGSLIDPSEDVLVLYATSHGADISLVYHYGDSGYGVLSPARLKAALEEAEITRRVLIFSACHSGVFVPMLASPDSAILTAAASNRSSFGCAAENDSTSFGDALVNRRLREPACLEQAARMAEPMVAEWERRAPLEDTRPLASIERRRGHRWGADAASREPAGAAAGLASSAPHRTGVGARRDWRQARSGPRS
jgi:hypothetical protein